MASFAMRNTNLRLSYLRSRRNRAGTQFNDKQNIQNKLKCQLFQLLRTYNINSVMKADILNKCPLEKLDFKYQQNVRPYETIIKAISMNNAQTYALQQKYKLLQKQYQGLKKSVPITELDIQKSKERKRESKKERNRFIEEALLEKEKDFDDQYKRRRLQRLEEIGLKYQQISMMREDRKKYNIFFNFEEGLLQEIIHDLDESGQEQLKKQIGVWLKLYKTSMKQQQR